jgi:transposase
MVPASVRIYVAAEAVDLRRGFDGLAAATRSLIRQDPLSGQGKAPRRPSKRSCSA